MSTNKVYGDNPNQLPLVKKKTRFEIRKKSQYFRGIKENFPIDNCTHSFWCIENVCRSNCSRVWQECWLKNCMFQSWMHYRT